MKRQGKGKPTTQTTLTNNFQTMSNLTSNTLVPSSLVDALYAAHAVNPIESSTKGSVRFDHPIITSNPDIAGHLETAAKNLGVTLEEVEEVLFFMVDEKGKLKVFQPSIKAYNGEVVIVWGKAIAPLSKFTVSFVGDKYVGAEFDIEGEDVLVPVRLNEESKTFNRQQVKKAYNAGTLAANLQEKGSANYAKAITELSAGVHLITAAVETVGFQGSVSFNFTVEGKVYKAPKRLVKMFSDFGVESVSEATPWAIHLGDLVTANIGGRDVTYRQVDHIATRHFESLDFGQFTFSTTSNVKIPANALSLEA